ncbi:MAG: hypothetical protein J6F30_00185 [Cellulosilyticum sp.]|nr:hypothetical protein [Cellulosilyticum sp.]
MLGESGENKVIAIYEKYHILTDFFKEIAGVSEVIAEKDACRMEHIISSETFEGIKRYMERNK